ncbi:MAG: ABC transporter permease [Candidatus Melainabacteria bacterium]|jgi:peptide/nickel transport system permease protein|nr:ABC transporter permease [Candidatus Melainabacteria bacterium]
MHPLFKSNLKFVLGCTIMALMCGMAVFAAISPDLSISTTCNLAQANISPLTDQRHPLGTDGLGRDLAAMLASGAQGSLSVGIFAAVGATIFGNLWGAIAAITGGYAEKIAMRIVDALLSIPSIVLLLFASSFIATPEATRTLPAALTAWLGVTPYSDGLLPYCIVITTIASTTWLESARISRARVLGIMQDEYYQAAIAMGAGNLQILSRHLLPALRGMWVIEATLLTADALIMESGLSFLGLGLGATTPSWGSMLQVAQTSLLYGNIWAAILPGLAIALTALAVYMLGRSYLSLIEQ